MPRKTLQGENYRFSTEQRSSTVYRLIIKKEGYVSQNTALWAKAVFLCSLEQQSVALHLRPIILHCFSETDKTYKMSNDMMTAYDSAVYFVPCICIWFGGFSRRGEKNLTLWTKAFLIWGWHTKQIATNSSCLSSLCWTAHLKKGASSINTRHYFFPFLRRQD